MSVRNLDKLFEPASVAVIGASNRPLSVGSTVMRNLLAGGFEGAIMPVNPKYKAVAGVLAYPDVSALPVAPDLAVICTPAATVPGLIAALGERGTRAAVVLSAGLREGVDENGESLSLRMLQAARPHLLRIVGPNCLGLLSSPCGLNASFAPIAFIAQSGAVASAVLDWSISRGIGFSHFLSIGDAADVDAGDLLDYLGSDAETRSILLYLEQVTSARKFMSAARAAARNKPVIVIKAGREAEGAAAAASHTGALAGADEVYDAAIRRAGMLRVATIQDLFNAAETLGRGRLKPGDPLTIITNGGGAGVMATDALAAGGGELCVLSEETIAKLHEDLPANWSRANPIDIIGDAPVARFVAALRTVLANGGPQTVLLIYAPTAIVDSAEIARAVLPVIREAHHTVLTCWMGGAAVAEARRICADGGVPAFETPGAAVAAHLQMTTFRQNQQTLMETPASVPEEFTANATAARVIIDEAVAAGRELLTEPQAKAVLSAYGLPVVETRIARDADHARKLARELGFPVALKVLSPDITHKSDIGGVALDLEDEAAVAAAAAAMSQRVAELQPEARLTGFSVQQMARRPGAFELIVGAREDPVFGPVVLFGEGGTAVEVIADRSVGLPPLNMALATSEGLSRPPARRSGGDRAQLDPGRAPGDRPGRGGRARHQSADRGRQRRAGARRAHPRAPGREQRPGPPLHPALPEGTGGDRDPGRAPSPHAPDPPRGRAQALRVPIPPDAGGRALPLLLRRAPTAALPDGALHPDRLRARDGLRRHRPGRLATSRKPWAWSAWSPNRTTRRRSSPSSCAPI
jgi:acetyltransferase